MSFGPALRTRTLAGSRREAAAHGADVARRDAGQGLVEYGLILGLAAVVTVVALVFFGTWLAVGLSLLGQAIDSAS